MLPQIREIAAFKEFHVRRGRAKPEYINYIKKAKQLEQRYANTLEKAQEDRIIDQLFRRKDKIIDKLYSKSNNNHIG